MAEISDKSTEDTAGREVLDQFLNFLTLVGTAPHNRGINRSIIVARVSLTVGETEAWAVPTRCFGIRSHLGIGAILVKSH